MLFTALPRCKSVRLPRGQVSMRGTTAPSLSKPTVPYGRGESGVMEPSVLVIPFLVLPRCKSVRLPRGRASLVPLMASPSRLTALCGRGVRILRGGLAKITSPNVPLRCRWVRSQHGQRSRHSDLLPPLLRPQARCGCGEATPTANMVSAMLFTALPRCKSVRLPRGQVLWVVPMLYSQPKPTARCGRGGSTTTASSGRPTSSNALRRCKSVHSLDGMPYRRVDTQRRLQLVFEFFKVHKVNGDSHRLFKVNGDSHRLFHFSVL